MTKGKISAVKFQVTNTHNQGVIEQYTLKIGVTNAASVNFASWIPGTSIVYGPINISAVVGWNEMTFATPYIWNGIENLVIEICSGDPNNATNTTGTFNSSVSLHGVAFDCTHTTVKNNSGNLCNTVFTTQTGITYFRPDTRFTWESTDSCLPVAVPYHQNFDTTAPPSLPICTYKENYGGNSWFVQNGPSANFTSNCLKYLTSNTDTADAWFFTRGLRLNDLSSYRLKYRYGNYSSVGGRFERMNVWYGTAPTKDSMHVWLADYPNITGNRSDTASLDFIPPATGVYYIGFHAYSPPNQFWLLLDDISVDLTSTVPIVLTSFTGRREGKSNVLLWNTATESNSKGFTVQRSVDGRYYFDVAFVPSRAVGGNSTTTLGYFYIDEHAPAAGNSGWYYRLKQIDRDGKASFSTVVNIKGESTKGLVITSVYPNPATTMVNIGLYTSQEQNVWLQLIDMTGRPVRQKQVAVRVGDNATTLETTKLSAGTYLLQVRGSAEQAKQVMKVSVK